MAVGADSEFVHDDFLMKPKREVALKVEDDVERTFSLEEGEQRWRWPSPETRKIWKRVF